jgi:hypothetical protein
MHGVNSIKFITAKQAKEIHQYKNLRIKLHKANAAMWYKKTYILPLELSICTIIC